MFPNSLNLRVASNAARAKAFSPSDIGTVQLKFDALTLTSLWQNTARTTQVSATGQNIAAWDDLSGNSRNLTQSNVDAQPNYHATGLNGRPAVEWAIGEWDWNYMLTPSFLGSGYDTAFSLFMIGSQYGADTRVAIDANNGRAGILEIAGYTDNTIRANQFSASQLSFGGSYVRMGAQKISANNIRAVGVSYDGANLRLVINGHVATYPATGNLGLSGALSVGNYVSPGDLSWRGMIGQIYLFNTAATELQMRQMCHYLLEQYGLTVPFNGNAQIFYHGDSLTAGAGPEGVQGYPYQMSVDLDNELYSHHNISQGGADIQTLDSYGTSHLYGFINAYSSKKIALLWGGSNNIAMEVDSPEIIVGYYDTWCDNIRAAGVDTIIVATMLPRSATGDSVNTESRRQSFNTLLRSGYSAFADALVDLAADTRIGDAGDELDTTYYAVDQVHMTTAGYTIVKDLFKAALDNYL